MRIGFDVDGVFADFNIAFIERVKEITGRDLFPAGYVPTTWNYPEALGYTPEEVARVWNTLNTDRGFWLNLPPYFDAMDILARIRPLAVDHDVYFITSRPGIKAKHQTEVWLATHSGDFEWNPTVLISSDKAGCASALRLDAYVDDRIENCHSVYMNCDPVTETFLLDRPWNQVSTLNYVARIESVSDMLDRYEALRTTRRAA